MSAPVVAPGALAIPGLLESIVEHIPAMVFLKEASELRFVLFNRTGEELLGFDRDYLRGKNDYDVFPKEQADFFTRKDREVLAGGRLVYIEEPITTAHGERWLLTRKIPIAGEGGLPRYLLGVSIDITERRAYEEALDANARLREALGALLSLEGVAAAGALASHTAARIVSALAGDDPASGAWEARALAAALAKLGAPDPRPAPASLDLTEALAAWKQRPDARGLARLSLEPSPGLRARVSASTLDEVLTVLLALASRLTRGVGAPVTVRGVASPAGPEVCLIVPSLALSARARAELPRSEPEAMLAAMRLAHADGALLVEPAEPGTCFRCRLCPDE